MQIQINGIAFSCTIVQRHYQGRVCAEAVGWICNTHASSYLTERKQYKIKGEKIYTWKTASDSTEQKKNNTNTRHLQQLLFIMPFSQDSIIKNEIPLSLCDYSQICTTFLKHSMSVRNLG